MGMSKPGGGGDDLSLQSALKRRRGGGEMLGFAIRPGFRFDTSTDRPRANLSQQYLRSFGVKDTTTCQ